ncbi:MAG: NAD-dependent epimerase/dehydratase family protein [Anaerolineales bacterium]|nr:MAG: NAD-dependent epimerase/dehydratase family protein [Anaerolineales bacterium]
MKVLVTGATGLIGGHIAKSALAQGWQVRGLRRSPQSTGHLEDGEAVEWMQGDLNDAASLQQAMGGVDVVFHAAAYYPRRERQRTRQQHLDAAQAEIDTVLSAAKAAGVRRMVYTSALFCIANLPPGAGRLADERDVYQLGDFPESAYFETKILMEQLALAANGPQLEVVVTNPTAVFGPGDLNKTLGSLLILAAKGYFVAWLPAEANVVDVRDVADAHIQAALKGRPGERYILGGHNLSVKDAFNIVAQVAGRRPPRFAIPLWLVDPVVWLGDRIPAIPLPANHLRSVRRWQPYNTAKAERELGMQARPFADTVRDSLAWFGTHGEL